MRLDLELLHLILEAVATSPGDARPFSIEGRSGEEVTEHVRRLWEDGCLDVMDFSDHECADLRPIRVTETGRGLLEAIRFEGARRAVEQSADPGADIPMSAVRDVALWWSRTRPDRDDEASP